MRPEGGMAQATRAFKLAKATEGSDGGGLLFALLASGKKQRRAKWKYRRAGCSCHAEVLREAGKLCLRHHMEGPAGQAFLRACAAEAGAQGSLLGCLAGKLWAYAGLHFFSSESGSGSW